MANGVDTGQTGFAPLLSPVRPSTWIFYSNYMASEVITEGPFKFSSYGHQLRRVAEFPDIRKEANMKMWDFENFSRTQSNIIK